jgi:glycyl-tRNA synthetase beta chain
MPRFAGDQLPQNGVGQAVAIADKLDTLVGIFGIGQIPTGDKDPFALRRAALGVVRICIEQELAIDLQQLIGQAVANYGDKLSNKETAAQVFDFVMERLRAYYHDQGITADVFDSVHERRPTQPYDFHQRVKAVQAFRALPEAESLAAANKRISNILKKVEGKLPEQLAESLLLEAAERDLNSAVAALRDEVNALFDQGDYQAALTKLASLREPVDTFFDHVMVMAEEESLRNNRLALLNGMHQLFLRVADLSRLQ